MTTLALALLLAAAAPPTALAARPTYAIVCDAGSTGTRLYVYSIDEDGKLSSKTGKKQKPGLSKIEPEDAAEYLLPLFKDVKENEYVPQEHQAETFVYVIATAGMRLLSLQRQKNIYDEAALNLKPLLEREGLAFKVVRRNFRTASGLEEGFWGFLAANFLQGRMQLTMRLAESQNAFSGVLDLGGSSTQIAYKCGNLDSTSVEQKNVFVHSFLGYGAQLARRKVEASVAEENPCDFTGYIRVKDGSEDKLVGSGNATACRTLIRQHLVTNTNCEQPPCFFDNVHKPSNPCGDFLAISLFYFATDCLRKVVESYLDVQPSESSLVHRYLKSYPKPSVEEMKAAADLMCSRQWDTAKKWEHEETPDLDSWSGRCFEVNYIATMIEHGYGMSTDTHNITFVKDLDGSEVEWTLGAFIEENLRLASTPDPIATTEIIEPTPFDPTGSIAMPAIFIVVLLSIPGCLICVKTGKDPISLLTNAFVVPSEPAVSSAEEGVELQPATSQPTVSIVLGDPK